MTSNWYDNVQPPESPEPVGADRSFWRGRAFRSAAIIVVVAGIGVGAYFIASSFTGNSTTPPAAGGAGAPAGNATSGPTGAGGTFAGAVPLSTGTIETVSSSSLTIKTERGTTLTVELSSSTTYSDGTSSTALSSLKAGDRVAIYGTKVASTELDATRVAVLPAGIGAGRGAFGRGARSGVFGTVESVSSSSFSLSSRNGTYTVDVTSSTTLAGSSGTALSGLSSLTKGETVIVSGTTSGTTVKATAVRVVDFGGGGFGGGGYGGGGGFGGGTPGGAPGSTES